MQERKRTTCNMKILFLIFHGFDPNNGISKKISYQLNAFKANGHEAHLCYMDETISKRRIVDDQIIVDYGNGILLLPKLT